MSTIINLISKAFVFLCLVASLPLAITQQWGPATYALAAAIILKLFDERNSDAD